MKTLGIIGGYGPETTAEFYLKLIALSRKKSEGYPPILIYNPPIPFELEKAMAGEGRGEAKMSPILINAAKKLERSGADFIVIPCNTVHIFIEDIRKSINVPVLSIIEETVSKIKKQNLKKVGLLATTSTIQNKLYQSPLEKDGVEVIIPKETDQQQISTIIPRILAGQKLEEDKENLLKIIKYIKINGTEAVVLACTDLPLLIKQEDSPLPILDTVDILANNSFSKLF